MVARSSSLELRYNDEDITELITDKMSSGTITDNASGEADTIALSLQNRSMMWLKGHFPQAEDYIKVWIKVEHWNNDSDSRKKYIGKYQIDSISAGGFPQTFDLEGISIPINRGFNVTGRNKTYKNVSVHRILKDIAKRAGVKLIYDAPNHKVDEMSQSGNTDMSFAFSLCDEYGLSMKVYNDKLVVYSQTRYERRKASFTIKRSDLGGSGAYDYQKKITGMYDSVKYQYTNQGGKTVTYEYTVPGRKGNRTLFISSNADSHADAERKAKAQLAANLRSAQSLTLTLMGDPKYKACQCFELEGFGKIDGKYFIDKVTHNFDSGYRCTIESHPVVTNIG